MVNCNPNDDNINNSFCPSQETCKTCPEGFFCDSTVQNDTYCSHGVQNPQPCPTGHFCPNGTKFGQEFGCPNGAYSDQTQLKSSAECISCPAGMYCGQEGLSWPSGYCNSGYYCSGRASSPVPSDGTTGNICDPGAYCPSNSSQPTMCPPGTYNSITGELGMKVL